VGGDDITGYSSSQLTEFRRTSVGFVFQAVNLVPFLTAHENLLIVDELAGRERRRRRAGGTADQLLAELGLTDRARNLPAQLSGGERQRVAIGRALMNNPVLILFDEPTTALASHIGDQVVRLIRDDMKARGTAAIIVTHDERITRHADRTVHIEDGHISAPEPPRRRNRVRHSGARLPHVESQRSTPRRTHRPHTVVVLHDADRVTVHLQGPQHPFHPSLLPPDSTCDAIHRSRDGERPPAPGRRHRTGQGRSSGQPPRLATGSP
jgi:ABC-type lipoprotein export system ATPase subunit